VPPFVEKAFSRAVQPLQLHEVTYLRNTAEAAYVAAAGYEWRKECVL
jgi:hypothetical protein